MTARTAAEVERKRDAITRLPTPRERKAIREAAGLTLEDIGLLVGVTRNAVCRWENGNRYPRYEYVVIYAEILDGLRGGQR